jgi:thiamine-monophosphate kinase
LGLVLPPACGETERAAMAAGLKAEQDLSGLSLLGGDTTAGGVLTFSVTMIGRPGARGGVTRQGARPGDLVAITGTIGDGLLGLERARHGPARDDEGAMAYRLPAVPYGFEAAVARFATASIDVSDGLVADLSHLAEASGVEIVIHADLIPLSARGTEASKAGRLAELLTGGDDYQTAFSFSPKHLAKVQKLSGVTVIGEVRSAKGESGAIVLRPDGLAMEFHRKGWDHFA